MIKKSTTLILGAGSAYDYNFPLGRGLLVKICNSLGNKNSDFFKLVYYNSVNDVSKIEKFRDSLSQSLQPSVDAFLEKRDEFMEIGKAAIVATLIPHESDNILLRIKEPLKWYEYLFYALDAKTPDEFSKNKLSIITFNYDRSLEYSLFNAIKNSYGLSNEDAASLLKTIPIIHLHGKLGSLPYLGENTLPYNFDINSKGGNKTVKRISPEIKIIHEVEMPTKEFETASDIINNSEIVAFLGFGYDETNISRLFNNFNFSNKENIIFCGTAFDLEDGERESVLDLFKKKIKVRIHLGSKEQDVLNFLKINEVLNQHN